MFLCWVPSQWSVPSDHLSVLSLKDGEGISNVVAPLVEFGNGEGILTGPIEQISGLEVGFAKEWANVVMFLGDSAVEAWYFAGSGGDGGGKWHFIFLTFGHVQILDMIECIFNIFEGLGALVAGKVGLDVGFFIHKKGGEDLVHVDSGDVVVVLFVDKVDEVHGFVVEAEETDPLFEVEVFVFDFFDDGRK